MSATQRILRVRRLYNQWVANQTLEDYALRFTARSARRWSHARVANTAVGSITFLALEAIGGLTTLNCGFTNAVTAIVIVSALIFICSVAVGYYAARYGPDIDLLTRGAGFGYIGSTISSMIYAVFTFIFLAIEAAIMAVALELGLGIPLPLGYVISALIIIPLVIYGITFISRLQLWTQPVWVLLQLLPFFAIAYYAPQKFSDWAAFAGLDGKAGGFQLALFGAAASVVLSLMGQIGEQVDFLRFMPPKKQREIDWKWWLSVIIGGPGWIIVGGAKMLAGSLLAVIAIEHGLTPQQASEPVEMYRIGFSYLFNSQAWIIAVTVAFVILSQVKINVTNAYAGSIAWSNFFARLTHSHPGRVVWLVFNVLIALLLIELGVYRAFDTILAIYSNLAVAWMGALVADLVVNKTLGISPPGIEFKRAYLHDINPVGFGAMSLASVVALVMFSGLLGATAEALSGFIGLIVAFLAAPAIALVTKSRYYIARVADAKLADQKKLTCCICQHELEHEDMASCPAYDGPICSLCCTLDARCGDRCKPESAKRARDGGFLAAILPASAAALTTGRFARYAAVFSNLALLIAGVVSFAYMQGTIEYRDQSAAVWAVSWNVFWLLLIIGAISAWMIVLARESRVLAQEESDRQTALLFDEISAHERTDAALQKSNVELQAAKESAERANFAKSRYMIGISHELRSPLNAVLGYGQLLDNDNSIPPRRKSAIRVVRRSAEHMSGLIDGLLDISKIESGRLQLEHEEVDFRDLLEQMADMFRLQATTKGLDLHLDIRGDMPPAVYGDGKRLRQILINLLSNAVKFTKQGSVAFRVRYRDGSAEIDVADTGCGIHPEDAERIFEPFERGLHASAKSVSGTGLGLTITKLLVTAMGGELTLASTPGQGSEFTVRLPLPEVVGPTSASGPAAQIRGHHGERRTVLVADDDDSHCAIVSGILEPLGFIVETVNTGAECLAAAGKKSPDLILLDITMPGMNGWDAAAQLRQHVSPQSRIAMVSGNAFEIEANRDKAAHHDAVLTKPLDVTKFLRVVADLLDIQWIVSTNAIPASIARRRSGAIKAGADRKLPDRHQLDDLRSLGEIGYVRGAKDKLINIGNQSHDYAWLVDLLEPMIEKLDFEQFTTTLSGLIEDREAE